MTNKQLINIVSFYVFSLIDIEQLNKNIPKNQDEELLFSIINFISNSSSNILINMNKPDIDQLETFKDNETFLSENKYNFVDFIFAISLYTTTVAKLDDNFDPVAYNKIINIGNVFFDTLKKLSFQDETLVNKIETSVQLSLKFEKYIMESDLL